MIGNVVYNRKKGNDVFPFLIRFAQKRTSEDAVSGKEQRTQHTLVTRVRRETTDDR